MTPKRKKVQDFILSHLRILDPEGDNVSRYEKFFSDLSDVQFDEYMKDLKDNKDQIYIFVPPLKTVLKMENILKTNDALGMDLFERVWLTDTATGNVYLTPQKYLILELPIRRFRQYLQHKLSVPDDDKRIDLLSGQVTKPDKAASLSYVEMQTLAARDLHNTIAELAKYRGGDIHAYAEFRRQLEENGTANVSLDSTGSMARSTVILDVFLSGMHIDSNIVTKESGDVV